MLKYTPVGVDIGNHTVKIAVVKKIGDMHQITKKEVFPIPLEAKSGNFSQWLAQTIKSFFTEHRIGWASLSFSVSCDSDAAAMKIIEMPTTVSKEIAKSIAFEIEEKMAVDDINNYHYKYAILEKQEESSQVYVALIRKSIVSDLKKIARIRWKINAIEPQLLSVGRMVEGNVAVIDFGHQATQLYIFKNGQPYSFHTIYKGGYQMDQAISDQYGLLYQIPNEEEKMYEAEKVKIQYASVLPDGLLGGEAGIQKEIADIVTPIAENIIKETKQVIRALEIRSNFVVDQLFYTGGGGRLNYLPEYLSQELELDAQPLMIDQETEENKESEQPMGDYDFAIACGAALNATYPYYKSLNFTKIPKRININKKEVFVGLLVLSVLSQLALVDMHRRYDHIQEELNNELNEIRQLESRLENDIQSEQIITQDHEMFHEMVQVIEDQKKGLGRVLYEIPRRTPSGVVVKELKIVEDGVSLQGYATSYSQIGFFSIALESLGEAHIDTISNDADTNLYLRDPGDLNKEFAILLAVDFTQDLLERDFGEEAPRPESIEIDETESSGGVE